MIEQTFGIVLRTYPLTETSLIVNWLTADCGRIATAAKGARRAKSALRGKLDLFYTAQLAFQRSRRSDLHTLREVRLTKTNEALRYNLSYLNQAAYCARLIEQTCETDTPVPAIYDLFAGLLDYLPSQPSMPQTVLAFELKLLAELGLSASQQSQSLSPGARQLVMLLEQRTWKESGQIEVSVAQVNQIQRFLDGFLVYHLGKYPAGRDKALLV